MSETITELHAIVHGRVQGVFFRAATRDHARHLGLKGTVRNLPNGDVEVYAQGDKATLERFVSMLENGPGFVDHVRTTYAEKPLKFNEFRIAYD